jgi:hypothetical protein
MELTIGLPPTFISSGQLHECLPAGMEITFIGKYSRKTKRRAVYIHAETPEALVRFGMAISRHFTDPEELGPIF